MGWDMKACHKEFGNVIISRGLIVALDCCKAPSMDIYLHIYHGLMKPIKSEYKFSAVEMPVHDIP